ncbi:hypothetical protein B0T20DRAFT_405185 [Sordaria brevicollis]|uniref:Uncharacterized protein n=1 Tax=Sordaria brevicollis TaxID=83679 RepID=A0AAE0UE09_SORBR|nr:hypothetical protein B0T20DRAFT_405185 [Sordaria brevicollis]
MTTVMRRSKLVRSMFWLISFFPVFFFLFPAVGRRHCTEFVEESGEHLARSRHRDPPGPTRNGSIQRTGAGCRISSFSASFVPFEMRSKFEGFSGSLILLES